jgi:uncharacterized OsmC-like protein
MSVSTVINGVDIAKIKALADHLMEDPSAGNTVSRSQVIWKGGFRNEIRVRELEPTFADSAEQLGGTNSAASPVEQVLGALGSCLAIGYVANASVRGIKIEELRIELEGHIDLPVFLGLKEGHAGYPDVTMKVYLTADASQEALAELHQHVLTTSPVGNTIQKAVGLSAELVST